jgi:hypothetical protein
MLRADRPWLEHALAAVAEGFCPNHGVPLTRLGFCFACECVYSLDDGTVVATYWPLWATGPHPAGGAGP